MPKIKPLPGAGISVRNPDGSYSTERTIGVGIEGREYVIPTLLGGIQVSNEQAVKAARLHGFRNYPSFNTVREANEYATERTSALGRQGKSEKSIMPKPKKRTFAEELAAFEALKKKRKEERAAAKVAGKSDAQIAYERRLAAEQEARDKGVGRAKGISEHLPGASGRQKLIDVLAPKNPTKPKRNRKH